MPLRLIITFVLLLTACPALAWAMITPSQVLVLYNADWTGDEPLTGKGQDSKEIAEHYVRMHTDPASGEQPYLLGLHCRHGIKLIDEARHLNQAHLAEKSKDNGAGVVLLDKPWFSRDWIRDDQLRDSRVVEFTLPGGPERWQLDTLRVAIDPDQGDAITVIRHGLVETAGPVAINAGKEWTLRLDASAYAPGPLKVTVACTDNEGKSEEWQASYVDAAGVAFSRTGRDGVRDDQHFLDDIALPVKAFLDDPANARPDGTLLKDHILYLVVSYGLPRTAIAPYGIARGVTDSLGNQGSIIAFEQRLQLLYYDEEKVLGTTPKPHRFTGQGPFTAFLLRAPQAWPLFGAQANRFVHPLAYQKKSSTLDDLLEPLPFTPANRNRQPDRHLFFVSRIDGGTPLEARALVDRAVYAARHAGAAMGRLDGRDYPRSGERVGSLGGSRAGKWLWEQGLRHLYLAGRKSGARLELFHLPPGEGFVNTDPVYLPGGVGGTVISHNGWDKGEMRTDLARGVTGTIGVARLYNGAPHIHSQSWWDDELLYPFLFRGKSLGEAWLLNQMHLGWIATFIGDPLYSLPAVAAKDEAAPHFDPQQDVQFWMRDDPKEGEQIWLTIDLGSTPAAPETAQLRATTSEGHQALCQTFESRPYARLGSNKEACDRTWQIETIDPYGNRFAADVMVDCGKAL